MGEGTESGVVETAETPGTYGPGGWAWPGVNWPGAVVPGAYEPASTGVWAPDAVGV